MNTYSKQIKFGSSQSGLSLLELLVAMVLSIALLGGVITMFTSSKGTYEVNSRLARVEENGRFAMQSIVQPIRGAGYVGCTGQYNFGVGPTSRLISSAGFAMAINFAQYDVAVFDYTGPGNWSPALDTAYVTSPADEGDVIAIHFPAPVSKPLPLTASMVTPTDDIQVQPYPLGNAPFQTNQMLMIADCENRTYFQATSYDPVAGVIEHIASAPSASSLYLGNSSANLGKPYLTGNINADNNPASVYPMQSVVFYLRDSTSGVGKSLWRRVDTNPPEELVEGVDTMQFQVGLDVNRDGQIDGGYVEPSDPTVIANPQSIAAVTISLLLSSPEQYGTIDADSKSYKLLNHATADFTAPGDHRIRQVLTTTATLRNIAR